MIYNTIMVQLDIDSPALALLDFACGLAKRFEASLIAFAAAEALRMVPGDIDGAASVEVTRIEVQEIKDRLRALKSEFDKVTRDGNWASWRGTVGDPTRLLALNARAADLLVLGSAGNGAKSRLRTIDPGELVISAGRPVLFVADGCRPIAAENVLVAWKDTREARRAVTDALPFLADARQVLVANVIEEDPAEARESAADVVRFLMKHGVQARSETLDAADTDAAEALLAAAVKIGADLLVSGGYGHSRLREWAFGGVTRTLLDDRSVNRLIAN